MKTLNLSKLFLASQIALIMACSENNSSEPVKNIGNAITFGTPYVNNKTKIKERKNEKVIAFYTFSRFIAVFMRVRNNDRRQPPRQH